VSEVSGVLVEKYDSLSVTFREKAPPFGKKSAGFAQNALGFDFSLLQPFMPLRDNPFAYLCAFGLVGVSGKFAPTELWVYSEQSLRTKPMRILIQFMDIYALSAKFSKKILKSLVTCHLLA